MIPRAFWLIFFYDLTIQGCQGVGRGLVPAAHADFAGATLMTLDVTQKNGFDATDGTLYLCFKTATEIEAGVPYLVKWEKATDYEGNEANYDINNPVFENVTLSNSTAQTLASETAGLETIQMVGTYSPVSVTANDKSILFLGDFLYAYEEKCVVKFV